MLKYVCYENYIWMLRNTLPISFLRSFFAGVTSAHSYIFLQIRGLRTSSSRVLDQVLSAGQRLERSIFLQDSCCLRCWLTRDLALQQTCKTFSAVSTKI